MFIFKILLIILIALPVIALGTYFYFQMLRFIRVKNTIEKEAIESTLGEPKKKSKRKNRKSKGSRKNEENEQQQ